MGRRWLVGARFSLHRALGSFILFAVASGQASAGPLPGSSYPSIAAGVKPAASTSPEEVPSPDPECCPPAGANPPTITDLIIILDSTSSMQYPCVWYGEARLAIAVWGSYDVVDACPDGMPLSVVRLRDDAEPLRPLEPITAEQKAVLRRGLMTGGPKGNAVLKGGFEMALKLLESKPNAVPQIVLFTDGHDCEPGGANGEVAELKRRYQDRLHFDVVAISSAPPVLKVLRALADTGQGNFTSVTSNRELATALAAVRSRCNEVRERIEFEHQTCLSNLATCCRGKADCEAQLAAITVELECCREEKTRLEERIACLEQEVQDLKDKLKATEDQLAQVTTELDAARITIAKLRAERDRLKQELAAANLRIQELERDLSDLRYRHAWLWTFWWLTVLALLLLFLLWAWIVWMRRHYLRHELAHCRQERAELEERLRCCHRDQDELERKLQAADALHVQDVGTIGQVRSDLALEHARADGLDRRLSECHIHLTNCQKSNATSDERIHGLLRELAHKKDCCCCCKSSPSVVYGPITTTPNGPCVTPSHGGNTPNNGNPNNGDPNNGNPNNADPNNGNPNNANPNNGNPNNANPNNGNPNNANPNNGNPNNSNPNNANPNNANPNNCNNNPIAETSSSSTA